LHPCNSFSNGAAGHDPWARNTSPGRVSVIASLRLSYETRQIRQAVARRFEELAIEGSGEFPRALVRLDVLPEAEGREATVADMEQL
jgi:hypothetical protein